MFHIFPIIDDTIFNRIIYFKHLSNFLCYEKNKHPNRIKDDDKESFTTFITNHDILYFNIIYFRTRTNQWPTNHTWKMEIRKTRCTIATFDILKKNAIQTMRSLTKSVPLTPVPLSHTITFLPSESQSIFKVNK